MPSAATGVFNFKANSLTRKSFSPIMESSGNQSPMITESYNIKNLSTIGGGMDSDIRKKSTPLGISESRYKTIQNNNTNGSNYNDDTFDGDSFSV